ncbi:conserved hypothetical protein [Nitrosococcus halophilus Nc 4]|uniref:Flagellar protein FliT n=2 Tax=Nitrosococcus halophilus TaxID=133539 RepID=D5BV78_NITHN|nr:conserved hypothetical protein [Nitrosococcus halophilus Nc 4]
MRDALDVLLVLSQKMLLKAQQGAWQELADLQAERERVLQQAFPQGKALVAFPFARQRLEQLLSLNEQTAALCQQERDHFAQGLRKLQQGSQACDTYRRYTL